jgi:hypothetical protein
VSATTNPWPWPTSPPDFVKDTSAWLATLGRVDDADSRIEIEGIRQRLPELADPRTEPERYGRLMSECNRWRHNIEMRRHVMPAALHGEKFKEGRKAGTGGPIRKAVARLLKRSPAMRTAELWDALQRNPPRDCEFHENRQGRYVDLPSGGNMGYPRFRNVVSEEKKKLKG